MNVLLINKFHYLKDGASRSYFDTAALLREQGHNVAFFSMCHPDNEPTPWSTYFIEQINYNEAGLSWRKKAQAALRLLYNRDANRRLQRLIDDFQPDVAHLHIVYHQLSPSIIRVLKRNNIPVVMTLHDYKIISPNYSLFHNGAISWRGCGGRYWQVVIDKAIKHSYLKSALAALEAYLHTKWLKTYDAVDRFIAPSECMKNICVRYGVPADKVTVIPHAVASHPLQPASRKNRALLFIGRLSEEKGLMTLLTAMAAVDPEITLTIAGDGPQRSALEEQVQKLGLNERVRFLGQVPATEVYALLQTVRALVVPSLWLEVFGYVALEALQYGTPVIAAQSGALPELVHNGENGLTYAPNDAAALARAITTMVSQPATYLPANVTASVSLYQPSSHYQRLKQLYQTLSTSAY